MGGLAIIGGAFLGYVLSDLYRGIYTRTGIFVMLAIISGGVVGLMDDWIKVVRERNLGLNKRAKMLGLFAVALTFAVLMLEHAPTHTTLSVTRFDQPGIELGSILWSIWAVLLITGSANAVNLTDGLDRLAIMPVMIAAGTLGVIAYAVGRVDFTQYLEVHYVPGTGEILIFCSALIGGGLGFLWYNAPPAAVFMGDTGSLALGGALGSIAVITKHEIVWAIIGGLFVLEALSVIIQVLSFKLTGRRVFLMAPIHHHYEKKGWAEPTIVIRFWIIALILAMIGLATLKVR